MRPTSKAQRTRVFFLESSAEGVMVAVLTAECRTPSDSCVCAYEHEASTIVHPGGITLWFPGVEGPLAGGSSILYSPSLCIYL